ncbi:MAG: mechanosensitive ion channel [Leptolyngbyaceae cyanobacterium SM2_5_2]|nr:mechanosensitive ion channel [Leptolyngbyaceae cyanobacterium SM2_5_2]
MSLYKNRKCLLLPDYFLSRLKRTPLDFSIPVFASGWPFSFIQFATNYFLRFWCRCRHFVTGLVLLLTLLGGLNPAAIAQPASLGSTPHPGQPVLLQNEPLFYIQVRVGSFSPTARAREISNRIEKTALILPEPPPFRQNKSLDDFYVSYELNAFTETPAQIPKIYSDLHQNIQDCCNAAGIEILSPHYRAMRDGNVLAVPEVYWPKGYAPPGFRIVPLAPPEQDAST